MQECIAPNNLQVAEFFEPTEYTGNCESGYLTISQAGRVVVSIATSDEQRWCACSELLNISNVTWQYNESGTELYSVHKCINRHSAAVST